MEKASKPQITIYGFGYVGKALWRFLRDHYEVQIVDPRITPDVLGDEIDLDEMKRYPETRVSMPGSPNLEKTKHAVICVPTKMNDDGTCDTSIVEEILNRGDHEFYLIKSTIKPGTTAKLAEATGKKIAFSPEYIGEGKYEIPYWLGFPHPTNMKVHDFHIFGGPKEVTSEWVLIWQKIAGWTPRYVQTDSTTAEVCKYMENSFLATKKIFCDEFYEIAKVHGVDYNELKELWLLDGRIGPAMTMIFPDARGFGGKCLPKDLNAIVKSSEEKGYEPKLIKQVLASNKEFRKE